MTMVTALSKNIVKDMAVCYREERGLPIVCGFMLMLQLLT